MSRLNDLLGPIFTNIKADLEQIFSKISDLRNAVNYPEDDEGEKILPTVEKMLTVTSDGNTSYEDIPTGDVVKTLLFDDFTEDDSRTRVALTINTSGTPVTGEVKNLRDTVTVLVGSQGTGLIQITDAPYLWYVSLGTSLLLPVTPGHTYKFAAKTPRPEDSWYSPNFAYFSPDFDAAFTTLFVKIPGTDGAIALDPDAHSTDGSGKIFNGSGLIVPEGMHYLVLGTSGIMYEKGEPNDVRDFKFYDYTEYETNATYGLIVDDPVEGDTYKVTYALEHVTSSNTSRTVNGASTYSTTLSATAGKLISHCKVVVGSIVYTPVDGVLTIDGSASNIKIIANAETPSDDTYLERYALKEGLIPDSLLATKLDTPNGLDAAAKGKMLYTDGAGGLEILPAPLVPDSKVTMYWYDVYSFWQAGYYYTRAGEYTQAKATETLWGNTLRTRVSCTPFDKLIVVVPGERYRYMNLQVHVEPLNDYVPSILIFDADKNLIQAIDSLGGSKYTEYVIPENGVYMAVLYYNDQVYSLQKHDAKRFNEQDMLDLVYANYRAYLRGTPQQPRTLDKVYICLGTDDLRRSETKALHEMYTERNIPYYIAAIPDAIKNCVTDDPYKTNYDYMLMCLDNGGEIVCHAEQQLTEENVTDFNTVFKYFYLNKRQLEFYGFEPKGVYKAGGPGYIYGRDKRVDAWATYLFEFGDLFGYSFPMLMRDRGIFEYYGSTSAIDNLVDTAFANTSYINIIAHEHSGTAVTMFEHLMTKLSAYQRGVDYEFITPSQLVSKLTATPL